MSITGLAEVSELANIVIGRIWPDKTEAEKQQLAAAVMVIQGQLDINKEEAKSPSLFVSGWRPALGWICGTACAWNWVGLPIAKLGLALYGVTIELSPADVSEMMPILLGMLGLTGFRSLEKIKGVAAV
jgi:hypothetical protein